MWFVSILVGVVSVAIGIYLLKKEVKDAVSATAKGQSPEEWRRQLEELGASFFDIANDLEGKYSVHERQIQDIEYLLSDYREQKIRQPKQRLSSTNRGISSGEEPVESRKPSGRKPVQMTPSGHEKQEQPTRVKQAYDSKVKLYTRGAESVEIRENSMFGTTSEQSVELEARRLLQKGYRVTEIAKMMGVGVGELRLILGMSEHKE